MKIQTYFLCLLCIIIGVVMGLGLGLTTGNPVISVLVVLCGIIATYLCHKRVTDVTSDDLSDMINGKAALKTLEVVIILLVIVFVGTTTFYWSGGYGTGMGGSRTGTTVVDFTQYSPGVNVIYTDSYSFNPSQMTLDDLLALEKMYVDGHKFRDNPYIIGASLGFAAIMLAFVFAAFSLYYNRKYGCTKDEKQD
jgi:uncharacterized membrane protein